MPARLGRYAVRRRIGSGGFATVWLAYDEQLDSPVAIKVLAENWTEDAHVRQRFLEEGRYLRKVESPHVVTVYDAGSLDDDRPYLVMSYADQGTLADRLEGEGLTRRPGLRGRPADRRGAARAPPARRAPPRHQARQRALPHRRPRARGHRCAGDGRRPRARQGARRLVAADDDRRHPVVRRPRAGPGRAPRRPRRPVLPGGPVLPAAERPPGVRPQLPVGRGRAARSTADVDRRSAVHPGGRGRRTPRARRRS